MAAVSGSYRVFAMVLRKLGPYTIHEPLGSGGMGTVYRGVEDGSRRQVAIKVLSPSLVTDPGFRDRFAAEIKSLEKLVHPNIVELYGFGEHDGQLFYAMELIDGSNLQEELGAGRRFTWREVIEFGKQICGALKHAHDHGIIHRDIKPANLVIDNTDHVRLTDFGIAKLFGGTSQTVDGGVLGTADYMSPEQAEGLNVTPRSDLYSLGAVLYALLAGRPPFQGKSLPEVVHKVRFEPPLPVRRLAPDAPEELEQVIDTLLSKEPDERIPTSLALSKRLGAIQESLSLNSAATQNISAQTDTAKPAAPPLSDNERLATAETAVVTPDAFQENATAHASVPIVEDNSTDATASSNRYTAVDQDYRKRLHNNDQPTESLWEVFAKWGGLLGLIAVLGWAYWYFSRPPSADELFAAMESSAQGDPEDLTGIADKITSFLNAFPDDRRRERVIAWQSDAELARQTRRLESLSKTIIQPDTIEAIEWLLIEALRRERTDSAAALRQFTVIINMFAADEKLSEIDERCLRIAKQRVAALTEPTNSSGTQKQIDFIGERIETATMWLAQDPEAARTILQSIIDFYQDKPWAKNSVDQARGLLPTQVDR